MKKKRYILIITFLMLTITIYSQYFNGIIVYKTQVIPKEDCKVLSAPPPEYDTVFFGSNRAMHRNIDDKTSIFKSWTVHDFAENKRYILYEVYGKTYLLIQNDSTIKFENKQYLANNRIDTLSQNVYRVISKMDTVIYEMSDKYNIPLHPMYSYFIGLPVKYTMNLPKGFCGYEYVLHKHSKFKFFSMDLFPELKKTDKVYENISLKKFMEEYMFR